MHTRYRERPDSTTTLTQGILQLFSNKDHSLNWTDPEYIDSYSKVIEKVSLKYSTISGCERPENSRILASHEYVHNGIGQFNDVVMEVCATESHPNFPL